MTPAPLTLARIRELRSKAPLNAWADIELPELDAALAAAEALARMAAWIAVDERDRDVEFEGLNGVVLDYGQPDVPSITGIGPTPLAALTQALDEAETTIERQGP